MDEVWVPSHWAATVFVQAGMAAEAVYVVPGWLHGIESLDASLCCRGGGCVQIQRQPDRSAARPDDIARQCRRLHVPQSVQVGGPEGRCRMHVCME